METKIVLSGIRATGRMHIGNLIGAIQHWARFSQDPAVKCYYFIADLHTLTTQTDPAEIRRDREEIVLDILAAGVDPERATIYCQTSVPEIANLAWAFSCLTSVATLERMHHWKEKKGKLEELGREANAGLLTYPVLMAADILGPKANIVPVGEDQRSHVEVAREIARIFNREYGSLFPEPQEAIYPGGRVPSLTADGKMGKSEADSGTIFLSEELNSAQRKLLRGVTDPDRKRLSDPGNPNVCNIYTLHTILSTPQECDEIFGGCTSARIGCIQCKNVVFAHIREKLEPLQERRRELVARGPGFISEILHEGGKKARTRFAETLAQVQDRMGITPY